MSPSRRTGVFRRPMARNDGSGSTKSGPTSVFLEQSRLSLAPRLGEAEVAEGVGGQEASARRALHKAKLDEIGLDNVLDRVARLGERGGDGFDADRAAAELEGDGVQIAPIHLVEPNDVDVEQLERAVGERARHALCAFDHGEVAPAPEQAPADARRAARALGDLVRAVIGQRQPDHSRAARDNALQLFRGVKIEPDRNAETIAQRGGEEACACRCADQSEPGEVDLHRARRRPGADDEVELEILHRRIENLLDRWVETVNLVDEQHVPRLEIGELPSEIARLADDRTRGRMEIDAELARDDLRQSGLAESRRADEQHVIERLAARFGGLDEDAEILTGRFLPGESGEKLRADRYLVLRTLFG